MMMKRARLDSADAQEKDEVMVDWVSGLPDDILVKIISRLPLKEAARTSVLSSRWKYLWTFTTSLNFDAQSLNWQAENAEETRSKYINMVNKVLESHKGLNVNEFRICFDLNESHESIVGDWIYTAMSKSVQNFELNLSRAWCGKRFTFPQECYNSLKNLCGLSSIKSLRSLCFSFVNVSGEILEFFMHNYPLDQLCVAWCKSPFSLKVSGSSIQLKRLAIFNCSNLEEVTISAASLLSFAYFGPQIKLHVENVPQLVDVSVSGFPRAQVRSLIGPFTRYFSQLENLQLGFCLDEVHVHFSQFELPKLRHLTLKVCPRNFENVLLLARIMNSCTLLEKLTLKLPIYFHGRVREMCEIPDCPIQHLKVLELDGFVGHAADIKFASYLFKNATMLEKVIIGHSLHTSRERARRCSKLLEPMLPRGIQLVTKYFNF